MEPRKTAFWTQVYTKVGKNMVFRCKSLINYRAERGRTDTKG